MSTPTPTPTPTAAATTNQVGTGLPVAGRECLIFGEKASAAGGSTVFCQRNFARTGTFAWRAVVNGGGCLSRRMTGKGADGRDYACRADGPGTNYWRPAG